MSKARKILRTVGKVLRVVVIALILLGLAANLYILAARLITGDPQPSLFGWSTSVVISGSMSGSIEVNDLILVHRQEQYSPGDVITYRSLSGSSLVTHRIVEQSGEGFVTKGDANNAPDFDPVLPEQIVGKVRFVIPRVGVISEYVKTPIGMICLVFLVIAAFGLPMLLQRREEQASENGGNKDE